MGTMASSISWSARLTIAAVFLLGLCQHAAAQYTVPYCATFNTADSGTRNESIYQSNSLCFNYCNGITPLNTVQYAFAVAQWQTCWCTDYAPSSSTSGCTLDCPGWQEEKCGNTDPSLYGYISLPASVSGTRGPSAATSSSANQATVTSSALSTTSTREATTSTSSSNTASTTTTRRSSTTSSTSSTWTPTPVTSLETITGQVRTDTVTPTVPPNAQATNELTPANKGGGGLGTAGFGAAAVPSRTMSENSRYVLGTDGRRVVETW